MAALDIFNFFSNFKLFRRLKFTADVCQRKNYEDR